MHRSQPGHTAYIGFVDYGKAFDRVDWSKSLKVLNDIGFDWRDRRLIVALYTGQRAVNCCKIEAQTDE